MRAVVVYESMYGNTHTVADAIGAGLAEGMERVDVVPVGRATRELLAGAGLLVVGGPTHVHGMSRERTRADAENRVSGGDQGQTLDEEAAREGLRDWFDGVEDLEIPLSAAFDTRAQGSALVTGRASKGIARRLDAMGCTAALPPESFLIAKGEHLADGERERARAWGVDLAAHAVDSALL